jgi:ATP-dependent DNA helicase RecQ
LAEIRRVYQALINYLQVPFGNGENSYYDFDLADFVSKFKIPPPLVLNTIKVLEQEDLLTYNEQVFLPSRISFICNKETLYEFEASHASLEPVIKSLLRSYEGIFDQEVNIHEKTIAFLLRMEPAEVISCLKQLDAFHIIKYIPQKDSPQLYFIQNRVKAEDLLIDITGYNKRKQRYKARMEAFTGYIKSNSCRSQLTGKYFGDAEIKPCGICDNCLHQKRIGIGTQEFSTIQNRIMSVLDKPVHSKDMMLQLTGIKKEQAFRVIEFLQAENKIEVNAAGMIRKVMGDE